jgi:transcription initiation factor IIF auxiliary subunit
MSLSIQQDAKYLGKDRWEWSVWIDGPSTELDAVERVAYVLHPTFYEPVRVVQDRSTNFRLSTSGWGAFTINANVVSKDGSEIQLQHDLVLMYPDNTPTTA